MRPSSSDAMKPQQWRDATGTTDLEMHLAYLRYAWRGGYFQGDSPARRLGYPETTVRSLPLAQHHSVAGERQ